MRLVSVVISAVLLAGCNNLPNERSAFVGKEGTGEIRCPAPPADVMSVLDKGSANFNSTLTKVEKVAIDASLARESKYQKIREIDPQLQTIETVHYRLCIEYSNGTFTKEEYKKMIQALPLYSSPLSEEAASYKGQEKTPISFPMKAVIAPAGTWVQKDLGLSIKVRWIGGICFDACTPEIKSGLEITTSSFQMPNYEAKEGFSTAFTHGNMTYLINVEKIHSAPGYVVIKIDQIKI